jgi:hypothetical protein
MTDAQDDLYGDLNKIAVFRKFAEEATKNSHTAIKQVWAALFTGGTFALLHQFDRWVKWLERVFSLLAAHAPPAELLFEIQALALSLLLFVVYLLTFYRFYVGNIRVFDMKYDEVFKFISALHDDKNWNRPGSVPPETDYQGLLDYGSRLSKRETFLLMMTTLLVVFLTVTPLNPLKFLVTYLFLLTFDLGWMLLGSDGPSFFSARLYGVFGALLPEHLIEEVFPEYATARWHRNNRICLMLLLVVLLLYALFSLGDYPSSGTALPILLWCGGAIAFMNCWVDLRDTWAFYNPKFSLAYASVAVGAKLAVKPAKPAQ